MPNYPRFFNTLVPNRYRYAFENYRENVFENIVVFGYLENFVLHNMLHLENLGIKIILLRNFSIKQFTPISY